MHNGHDCQKSLHEQRTPRQDLVLIVPTAAKCRLPLTQQRACRCGVLCSCCNGSDCTTRNL